MPRAGPWSRFALLLSAIDLWVTILLVPASCAGLGWVATVIVLITSPLTVLVALLARGNERDRRSLAATGRALVVALATLVVHLAKLALLGP